MAKRNHSHPRDIFSPELAQQVLMHIYWWIKVTDRAPSTTDIAKRFGVSGSAPVNWLVAMEADGMVMLTYKETPQRGRQLDARKTVLTAAGRRKVWELEERRRWLFRSTQEHILRVAPLAYFAVTPDRQVSIARGALLDTHHLQPKDFEGRPLHEIADIIRGFVPAMSSALEHNSEYAIFHIGENRFAAYASPVYDQGKLVAASAVCFEQLSGVSDAPLDLTR